MPVAWTEAARAEIEAGRPFAETLQELADAAGQAMGLFLGEDGTPPAPVTAGQVTEAIERARAAHMPLGQAEQVAQASQEAMIENLGAKEAAFEAGASAWISWNGNYAYTSNVTSSTVPTTIVVPDGWANWNAVHYSTTTGRAVFYNPADGTAVWAQPQWITWNTDYQETEDERAERERQQAERRAELARQQAEREEAAARRRQEREEAKARAEALLRSLLSEEQRATLDEHGWFEVRGSAGGRWRIRCSGQSGNVDLMPEHGDQREATYCAHPLDLPDADAWIAQMLALVTDEGGFTEVANLHWRRPGFSPRAERRVEAVPGPYEDNPVEIRPRHWLRPVA